MKTLINEALDRGCPFAVAYLPGSDEARLFVGEADGLSSEGFFVNTFCNTLPRPIFLRPVSGLDEACRLVASCGGSTPEVTPCRRSTTRDEYLRNVGDLIVRLKKSGGKTVVSRVICSESHGYDDWADRAFRYFRKLPSTFRFIYYTPATGAWLGASPETLLSHDRITGELMTMALAGTRSRDAASSVWDAKNDDENRRVVDYIVGTLRSAGLDPKVGEAENVGFGAIQHLCHRITADARGVDTDGLFGIAGRLSPTPALAGAPLDEALANIAVCESHPRHCYGGYVGILGQDRLDAFVNLRSAHFDSDGWCVYSGGGITPYSDAADEWAETEAKAAAILEAIR